MELRRALLLFAVVLGLAAVATSFSRPAGRDDKSAPDPPQATSGAPSASPRPGGQETALVSFSSSGAPATRLLPVNRPATVTVEVTRPGQVELEGLGQTAVAEPLTPARFDVLASRLGRYLVRFTPSASASETRTLGALQLVPDD